jgi:hypothetical protein
MCMQGWYMVEGVLAPCSASVELGCVLKFGLRRRSVACTELLIDCSDAPVEIPPTIGIVMGITVAPVVRRFLDELAGGIPEGLPRRGEAGLVQRARLLLPKGSTWPVVEGVEQICDALTSILAAAGIRPSGVRVCVKGMKWRVLTWRLPCVLGPTKNSSSSGG